MLKSLLRPSARFPRVSFLQKRDFNEKLRLNAMAKFKEQLARTLNIKQVTQATQTAKKPVTPIPLVLPGVSGKAAMALWRKVYDAEGLEGIQRVQKELEVFLYATKRKENATLWNTLLYTPDQLISRDHKNKAVLNLLNNIGASPLFIRAMLGIFNSKSVFRLEQLVEDYSAIVRAFKREVDVTIVTKAPMDQTTTEFLKATVALNFLEPEDNMIFNAEVDPKIIDGYRVIIKGKVHDFTNNKAIEAQRAAEEQLVANIRSQLAPFRDNSGPWGAEVVAAWDAHLQATLDASKSAS